LLQNELRIRGLEEEASKLDHLERAENPYQNLSLQEIQVIVSDRLETGESWESIHTDLKEHGISAMDLFQMENERKELAIAIDENERGGSFPKEKLMNELNYKEEELEDFKSNIHGSDVW
jgi:hypothetical protein